MKTIIAGSRTITRYSILLKAIKASGFEITEVVSGTAKGVDRLGETYGHLKGIPVERFPADWKNKGKAAGIIRNREMAEYAEALIAVWDGTSMGTANMIRVAKQKGLEVFIYKVE